MYIGNVLQNSKYAKQKEAASENDAVVTVSMNRDKGRDESAVSAGSLNTILESGAHGEQLAKFHKTQGHGHAAEQANHLIDALHGQDAVILGDDNASMAAAANKLKEIGGGMVIAESATGKVYSLSLDIGGLMSSRSADELIAESSALYERAYSMGVNKKLAAFMTLAFLSLAVIPHVKLLDTGLFDVDKFTFTDIDAD